MGGERDASVDAIEPLAAALAAGDRATAIRLIDERFGDGLFRFIHAMVRRDDVADDLYQTTLLEAFRNLGSFAERSALRTWLFGIARHRCLDALKAEQRREARIQSTAELPETADVAPGAVEQLGQGELLAALGRHHRLAAGGEEGAAQRAPHAARGPRPEAQLASTTRAFMSVLLKAKLTLSDRLGDRGQLEVVAAQPRRAQAGEAIDADHLGGAQRVAARQQLGG